MKHLSENQFGILRSYSETLFEITSMISYDRTRNPSPKKIQYAQEHGGSTAFYDLAIELAKTFETIHQGAEWDGEFFEAVDEFYSAWLNDTKYSFSIEDITYQYDFAIIAGAKREKQGKRTFRVFARTTEYPYLDVEAYTEEEAEQIAENTDGGEFIPDENGTWDIDTALTYMLPEEEENE